MSERSQSQWDTAIQAAMEGARLKGDLPENLQRNFTARLQPKADWRDLYMLAVSRKVGNDRYTWGHMDQQLAYRHIGAPGRSTYACGLIVIAMDTLGSINQRTRSMSSLPRPGRCWSKPEAEAHHPGAVRCRGA